MAERADVVPVGMKGRRRLPPARSLLGVLLVAMAAGQVSDVGGFGRILGTYRLLPDRLLTVAAWAFLVAEATAGISLLRGRRYGASLALAVALAWTVLGSQAFGRGLTIGNCGCFGVHLRQPLRWWVLLEDAEFIALAAWVRRTKRPASAAEPQPVAQRLWSQAFAPAGRRDRTG